MDLKIFKSDLFEALIQRLENQILASQTDISSMREALANEQKSSAGDKHETSRAMLQIEMDKIETQLFQLKKLMEQLIRFRDFKGTAHGVTAGSLLETNQGYFLLAGAFGRISHDRHDVMVISADSPLGSIFLNKKPNETFQFMDRFYQIRQVI